MKQGGQIQAAIEVLTDVLERHRPVSEALKDWGRNHRFAGSGDRAAIGNLVYDCLRRKAECAWLMGAETPRALALATYAHVWGKGLSGLKAVMADDPHAPEALNETEEAALSRDVSSMPDKVRANMPDWLWQAFQEAFEDDALAEAMAFCQRPPVDIRVNTLKADRDKVMKALSQFKPKPTAISPIGIRFEADDHPNARTPNVQATPSFEKGWFEVQDEGSQIAAILTYARPGQQVLDYCAGAGGKTLALSAAMENKGQIFAYDANAGRLAASLARIKRAGTRNVQVREPRPGCLDDLEGKMDLVLVDAPCTGSGTWRRRPETKWKLSRENLEDRREEQSQVLEEAKFFPKIGGYLIYITCSVLYQENEAQVYSFVEENPNFELVSAGEVWQDILGFDKPKPWSSDLATVTMTPASTGTDGFFFAVLERRE